MDKLRILCWGINNHDEVKKVCERLYEEEILEVCVSIPYGNNDYLTQKQVPYLIYSPSQSTDDEIISAMDFDNSHPLGKHILEAMLPYQSTAIEMGVRRTSICSIEYTREKQKYYRELRHIRDLYEAYRINAFFSIAIPHFQDGYIAYAYALINDIPITIYMGSEFQGLRIVGNSIESIGRNIADNYHRISKEKRVGDLYIVPELQKYYNLHTLSISKLKKLKDPGIDKESKLRNKQNKDYYFGRWGLPHRLIWNPVTRYLMACYRIKQNCISINNKKTKKIYWEYAEQHAMVKYYMKYYKMNIDEYNKMAVVPDYSERYVFFAMQFEPEATTLPQAGVFSSQYLSIELLANVLNKYGIKLYVKEHCHLAMRSKHFYDEITSIPNVKFIKTTVSTYDIIENSLAVSTQTGTCILEGILRGKPAIVFGDGYLWKDMPGLYKINEVDEGEKVIRELERGRIEINQDDVLRYFSAISNSTVKYVESKSSPNYNEENNIESLKNTFIQLSRRIKK